MKLLFPVTTILVGLSFFCLSGCASFTSENDSESLVAGAEVIQLMEPIGEEATAGAWPVGDEVKCSRTDVKTTDLGTRYAQEIPERGWDERSSQGDRCGDDYETLLFRLANCERQARRIPPLQCDERLVWVGRAHSHDMIARDYFSHIDRDGRTPGERLQARGLRFRRTGENLALAPNMALGHQGWMHSRGHRESILNPEFSHFGVGVIRSDVGFVMTALFSKDF